MSLEISPVDGLRDVKVIVPRRHQDERGFFSETWRSDAAVTGGIDVSFLQENHVLSRASGTLRGLHFQIGASAQAKLVRCIKGGILDVAVDIRRRSPTYGRHVAIELSAANWKQLYVPVGFAHGYCTLEPDSEVIYKVSAYYDPAAERGLAWDDPDLGIAWPVEGGAVLINERDRSNPRLRQLPEFFAWGGEGG